MPLRPGLDAESQTWLARLGGVGPDRDAAMEELLVLLLNASKFVLARRRSELTHFPREGFDELAHEAADDALISIMASLGDYRGESKFTTWAWKFAFFEVSGALRRRNWMAREIPSEHAGWETVAREASPQKALEQRELLVSLKTGVERVLTPHQRTVFVALALNGVPVDVLAARMQTSRGALYKTLHDARSRLRVYLDLTTGRCDDATTERSA